MANNSVVFAIDPKKTRLALQRIAEEHNTSLSRMGVSLGHSKNWFSSMLYNKKMSWLMYENLRDKYNATKDMFTPDPEPQPEPEPAPEVKPVTVAEILPEFFSNPDITKVLGKMTDIEGEVKKLGTILPNSLDTEISVKDAVVAAMSEVKRTIWKDMLKDLRGCVFSAMLEAMKKHDELMADTYMKGGTTP